MRRICRIFLIGAVVLVVLNVLNVRRGRLLFHRPLPCRATALHPLPLSICSDHVDLLLLIAIIWAEGLIELVISQHRDANLLVAVVHLRERNNIILIDDQEII